MPIGKSDLKLYYTSVAPEIEQTTPSQSIGGYCAYISGDETASLVYPSTTLSGNNGLYDSTLTLAGITGFSGLQHISINEEIVKVSDISSTTISVLSRGFNGVLNAHRSGDLVRGLSSDNIFNTKFNNEMRQYRCIALKNTSALYTALNVDIFFRHNSRSNGSSIRMAVEMPKNDYASGTSTDGSSTTVVDSSLIDVYDDEYFSDAMIRITSGSNSGQTRIVLSFDSSTGSMVLDSALPYTIGAGIDYEIEPGPAQRLVSGVLSPSFNSGRTTALKDATRTASFNIDVTGSRTNGKNLLPGDLIYIWLEREIREKNVPNEENSAVLTINYLTSP